VSIPSRRRRIALAVDPSDVGAACGMRARAN
jgi:hypothetical protein